MVVFKDNLCVILDLEGFFINKTFHVRELGYYTWNGEHGRHAFSIPIPYKTLHDKDKRTVHFVCRKIHGLTYQPCDPEIFQDPRILGPLVKDIHQEYSVQMVPLLTRPRRSPLLSPSHPPISNPLPRDVRSEGG